PRRPCAGEGELVGVSSEHLLIQEKECSERLMLRARRDASNRCEVRQKLLNRIIAQFTWMRQIVEPDVALDPRGVCFLRAVAIVPQSDFLPHLIQIGRASCRETVQSAGVWRAQSRK